MDESQVRKRLQLQAQLAQATLNDIDSTHLSLIQDACRFYAPHFLPGYEVIFIDDADGERVTESKINKLRAAGVALTLDDSMPDVLLWNPQADALWVIEAVCSDGEVDWHKMANLKKLAERSGKSKIGFTTIYADWKSAARRQGSVKNLAPHSFLWIRGDGSKHFQVLPPVVKTQ